MGGTYFSLYKRLYPNSGIEPIKGKNL